jgi:hypothetical protein
MNASDAIRNNIIDKLLTISNKSYLAALKNLIESSGIDKGKVKLSKEQTIMLELSEVDIREGKMVSQNEIDKADLKWLKEM